MECLFFTYSDKCRKCFRKSGFYLEWRSSASHKIVWIKTLWRSELFHVFSRNCILCVHVSYL